MLLTERPTLRLHLSSPGRKIHITSSPPHYNLHYQDHYVFPEPLSSPVSPTPQPIYPPTGQPIRLTGSVRSIFREEENDEEPEFILPPTPKFVPIALDELSRSGEKQIYENYYKSSPLQVNTSPAQSIDSPSSLPKAVKLLETEDLYLELPREHLDIASVPALIQEGAKLVADHFQETKSKDIYAKGSKETIDRILDVFDNHPNVHNIIQSVLKSMAGITDEIGKIQTSIWIRVPYKDLEHWSYSLKRSEYRILLGYIVDTPVILLAIGRVECQGERENDVTGYCTISKPGTDPLKGFVLGGITGTGTAIIIDENEQMLAYHPFNAIDPKWELMKEDSIVILQLADDGRSLRINPVDHQEDVKVDVIQPEDEGDYLGYDSDDESEDEEKGYM